MQTIRKFLRPSKARSAASTKAVNAAVRDSLNGDAKLYVMINEMTARQLGGCILQAGLSLPIRRDKDTLRDVVRSCYQDGTIEATIILDEYEAA